LTTAIIERRAWIKQAELQRFLDAGCRREQVFEVLVGVGHEDAQQLRQPHRRHAA
jgi:hypothetical protein